MITALLIIVALVVVISIIGGFAMMIDNNGSFLTWWFGYHAFTSGLEVLAKIVPAIIEALADAASN